MNRGKNYFNNRESIYKRGGGWACSKSTRADICIRIFTYAVRGGVQDRDCPRLFHLVEIPSLQTLPPPNHAQGEHLLPLSQPPSLCFSLPLIGAPKAPSYRIAGHYGTYVYGIMHLPPTVIIPRYKLHNPVAPYPPASWLDHFVMSAPQNHIGDHSFKLMILIDSKQILSKG